MDPMSPIFDLQRSTQDGRSATARINTYLFVADHDEDLRPTAYRLALSELVQHTIQLHRYVELYQTLEEQYSSVAWYKDLPPLDTDWVKTTRRQHQATLQRWESELHTAKESLDKSGVQMALYHIGQCYFDAGDWSDALKYFTKLRTYCSNPVEFFEMYQALMATGAAMGNWVIVGSYLKQFDQVPKFDISSNDATTLLIYRGLLALREQNFHDAAGYFQAITTLENEWTEQIISPAQLAMYITLCALVTYSRDEIHHLLHHNDFFKRSRERDSDSTAILQAYYRCDFGKCRELLQTNLTNVQYDQYLSPFATPLLQHINQAVLLQYLKAFSTIQLDTIAKALRMSLTDTQDTVLELLLKGTVQGQLDYVTGLLRIHKDGSAQQLSQRLTDMEKEMTDTAMLLKLRAQWIRDGFQLGLPPLLG
ncbi:cop9 signalosome complex subunit [Dispira simplex]|nr:cop9 signalosome complex subunit [Dispira simplex]